MNPKLYSWIVILLLLPVLFSITACNSGNESADPSATANTPPSDTSSVPGAQSPTPIASLPRLEGKATVVLQVNGQPITIVMDGQDAPITAGNFVDLVNRGVYNGTSFHRVVREPQPFVAQGGDPQSKDPNVPVDFLGTGSYTDPATGKPRYIPLEIEPEGADKPIYSQAGITQPPKLKHTRGAVAMARSQLPDSASAQFYIALGDLSDLNGNYAVFGYVTEGMNVVDQIKQGDRIESAKVTQGLENLKVPAATTGSVPTTSP